MVKPPNFVRQCLKESRDNGDESTFAEVEEEVSELLRSGYFFLEAMTEL